MTDIKVERSGEILAKIMVDLAGLAAENERLRSALRAILNAANDPYMTARDALAGDQTTPTGCPND
jgi:hypothetical protein